MLYLDVETMLQENLPHGSGIDCDWKIEILKNGTVKAHNSFTCYNESGMIDGYQDFYLIIKLGGDHHNRIGLYIENVCFSGKRYLAEKYMLRDYFESLFFDVGTLEQTVHNGFKLDRYIG